MLCAVEQRSHGSLAQREKAGAGRTRELDCDAPLCHPSPAPRVPRPLAYF